MKNKWFSFVKNNFADGFNVVMFAHAGAGASSFAPWGKIFDNAGFNFYPVQYPHRESRMKEPMIYDICEIAESIVNSDPELFSSPKTILYGKCLGVLVAYEVAKYMKQKYGNSPCLFVTSSGLTPEDMKIEMPQNPDDEDLMKSLLLSHGFAEKQQLENQDFINYYLPVLKDDYIMQASYNYKATEPLECNITALYGKNDPKINEQSISKWSEYTNGTFKVFSFDGEHFFENRNNLAEIIKILTEAI